MTNRERKIWMWEKRIRRKKDRPLSREGWIMFLSDKINERYMTNGVLAPICFACVLAGLSGIVAFSIADMDIKYIHVLSIFAIVSLAFALIVRYLETKRVKLIEGIRDGIILKEEGFKTYEEIRDQCKNAGVIVKRKKNKLLKEKDVFYEEHHNSGNTKMKGIKRSYLIVCVVFDLIALLTAFSFIRDLFIFLLLINIIFLAVIIPLLLCFQYLHLIIKQQIGSKEYYMTLVEIAKEDRHFGNEVLTKMFEMRMTNLRHTIFAFLGFLLMLTLTIVVNSETLHKLWDSPLSPLYWAILAVLGLFGILILLYCSFGLDRYAIKELDELFKLKKESDDESAKSIEESRTKE